VSTRCRTRPSLSAWYGSSPHLVRPWGGKNGDRNHTEFRATYDSNALYLAFLNVDRSRVLYPGGTITDLTAVDSSALWIETPPAGAST
jgi:hypothetical protein